MKPVDLRPKKIAELSFPRTNDSELFWLMIYSKFDADRCRQQQITNIKQEVTK